MVVVRVVRENGDGSWEVQLDAPPPARRRKRAEGEEEEKAKESGAALTARIPGALPAWTPQVSYSLRVRRAGGRCDVLRVEGAHWLRDAEAALRFELAAAWDVAFEPPKKKLPGVRARADLAWRNNGRGPWRWRPPVLARLPDKSRNALDGLHLAGADWDALHWPAWQVWGRAACADAPPAELRERLARVMADPRRHRLTPGAWAAG